MSDENKGNWAIRNQWAVPTGVSAILGSVMNSVVTNYPDLKSFHEFIIILIPPLSILIGRLTSWITAKYFSLSILETKALSRLKKNEKLITKELKKENLSPARKEELQAEIDDISRERTSLLKKNNGTVTIQAQ